VHRASLRSGRQVVFKVQRPGLERLFRLDLEVMQQVAAVIQRHPRWGRAASGCRLPKNAGACCCANLISAWSRTCRPLSASSSSKTPASAFPAVIWELSSRRVLCLD